MEYDEFVIADGKRDDTCTRSGRTIGLALKETDEDEFVKLIVGRKASERIEVESELPGLPRPARELRPDSDSREMVINSVLEPVPADEKAILSEMDCESMDEAIEKWESFSEEVFGPQSEAVWRANLSHALQRELQFEVPPTLHAMQSYSQFGFHVYPDSYMWTESEMGKPAAQPDDEANEEEADSPLADSEADAASETNPAGSLESTEESDIADRIERETMEEIKSTRSKWLGQSVGPRQALRVLQPPRDEK